MNFNGGIFWAQKSSDNTA